MKKFRQISAPENATEEVRMSYRFLELNSAIEVYETLSDGSEELALVIDVGVTVARAREQRYERLLQMIEISFDMLSKRV